MRFILYKLSILYYHSIQVISPALGTTLMEKYSDTLVVALATAIAILDVFFILVAVPESLPEKIRPSTWGTPINWEHADPFAVCGHIIINLLLVFYIF